LSIPKGNPEYYYHLEAYGKVALREDKRVIKCMKVMVDRGWKHDEWKRQVSNLGTWQELLNGKQCWYEYNLNDYKEN
jgi:hypothetical protein